MDELPAIHYDQAKILNVAPQYWYESSMFLHAHEKAQNNVENQNENHEDS